MFETKAAGRERFGTELPLSAGRGHSPAAALQISRLQFPQQHGEESAVEQSPHQPKSSAARLSSDILEFTPTIGIGVAVLAKYAGVSLGWTVAGGALIAASAYFIYND